MRHCRGDRRPIESEVHAAAGKADRAEVERLVTAQRGYLKRVISLRMDCRLQSRVDPSDLVQETQLEAVQRVGEYLRNPALSLRVWLRRLACDAVVDAQRRHIYTGGRSVKREIHLPERLSQIVARRLLTGVSSPSARLSKKEMARAVRQAVERLGKADREVVLLMAFEGLNSNEAAQVLEIEPSAARKRYGRALLKLQAFLLESGLGESRP